MSYYLMHRGWLDHPAFGSRKREPFCRAAAWAWLIEHAAFDAKRVRIAGKSVTLGRGQLSYSLRFLADAWGWSLARVRRFLDELQNRHMIAAESEAGQTVVTICNYSEYQNGIAERAATPDDKPAQQRHSSGTKNKKGKEGEANRTLSQSEKTESVSPRASADDPKPETPPSAAAPPIEDKIANDPVGRSAPPQAHPPDPPAMPRAVPPPEPTGAALRKLKKDQLRQKCCRFVNATMRGAAQHAATLGLMGCDPDPNHDAQWWLDEVDRYRRRAGWDDMRDARRNGLRTFAAAA